MTIALPCPGNLTLRVLSVVVLAPPVLAAVVAGGIWLTGLIAVLIALACWEWSTLAPSPAVPAWPAAIAVIVAAWLLGPSAGIAAVFASAVTLASVPKSQFSAVGLAYLGAAGVSLLWLASPAAPPHALVWLLAVVWSSDIGGYVVGRTVGGAKLAPHISPNKTWSGLFGAVSAPAVIGSALAVAGLAPLSMPHAAAATAALLGLVGQAGDLIESTLKRRAGVKDSGRLIPGHGGVLDRVDALVAAAIVLAVLLNI